MEADKSMFGQRLRKFMQTHFGTVNALSEKSGIDRTRLSRYLNGHTMPRQEQMEKLANVGLNVNWALTGEGGMDVPARASHIVGVAVRAGLRGEDFESELPRSEFEYGTLLEELRKTIARLNDIYIALQIATIQKHGGHDDAAKT